MSLRLVTDASAEPISLADIKTHLRLSTVSTVEDDYLNRKIKAARRKAESLTKRCCLPQTWKLTLDGFPGDEIVLMRAPLSSVATDVVITYLDAASGNSTTLSTSYYGIDYEAEPGRIYLKDGYDWPETYTDRQAVTVQFVAGFKINTAVTPSTDTTPEEIEDWIMMRAAAAYEWREPLVDGKVEVQELPRSYMDGLLDEYCLIDVRP